MKHLVFVALLAAAFGMPLGDAGARPNHRQRYSPPPR
jgi:hypothetical protein